MASTSANVRPQSERPTQSKPANAGRAIGGQVGKDAQGSATPAQGAVRRRRKNTADNKRLADRDPFWPAFEAAADLIMTAIASARVRGAISASQGAPPTRTSGFENQVVSRLDSVRTVEQFRAAFSPTDLQALVVSLENALGEKSRAILDGIGNHAYNHALRERYRMLAIELAGQRLLPCPEEELDARLEAKSAELGRPALLDDLGPCELVYPSKKKWRAAIAAKLGVDERSVRRFEREKDWYDERIFKSRADAAAERLAIYRKKYG